jgi:hypothetical protein
MDAFIHSYRPPRLDPTGEKGIPDRKTTSSCVAWPAVDKGRLQSTDLVGGLVCRIGSPRVAMMSTAEPWTCNILDSADRVLRGGPSFFV